MTTLAHVPMVNTRRVMVGVALSMLVHAAVLWAYRPAPYVAQVAPAPLTVHLQAPEPVRTPLAAAPAASAPARAARPARTPRRVIAVAPSASNRPDVVVEAQPETAPPPPKKFDMDAARSAARRVADTDAPNADDAPLFRLKKQQEMEMATETKAARVISAAKRGDCKDGLPGGLLAPLIMLTQKKGTGCKW